jgi:hypothetical protein
LTAQALQRREPQRRYQTTELDDYGFFTADQAARRVAPHVSARISAAVHAATAGITIYLPLNADSH